MRKPSVLFINRVYAPAKGATGRVLADLAQGFEQDGWTVGVLTTGPQKKDEKQDGVWVRYVKAKTDQTVLNYLKIWIKLFYTAYRLPRTDLIVTMTDPPMLSVAGKWLSKIKRVPHIHWSQDLYPDLLPVLGVQFPKPLMERLQSINLKSLQSADRVVVIGQCMAERLQKMEFDHRRMSVIPNWADRELHASDASQFHASVEPLGKTASDKPLIVSREPKFRVLYAGNLGKAHPVATILEAACILQITNPEIEFLFVGEGPGFDHMASERLRLGLENIRLLPTQPKSQLREMMRSGDLHLISMKNEAAGMLVPSKLYAALAAERPCILVGPEHSETGRILQGYGAGTVIEHGDAKMLAETILQYRNDGSKWFETHKGARKAAEDFNADKAIKNWIACARSTIQNTAA